MAEEGLVSLRQASVDGTKIEAHANRYTFVWADSIKTSKEKMLGQLEELWKYAQSITREEDKDPESPEFKEISKEKIRQTVENIHAKLNGSGSRTGSDKKARAKLEKIRKPLISQEGIRKRKQRSVEVEPVFAHLKHGNGFNRFTLKGLKKVELKFGLHALSHNLRKKFA